MRLVTDDPRVYITWILISILAVVIFVGILFFIAWFQVYVIAPFKRRRGKK